MVPEAQRLHAALVAAFPAYVTEMFVAQRYPLDRRSAEAIETATAFLDVELSAELELPYREQRRSPLELFRAALEVAAVPLAEAGVVPPNLVDDAAGSDPYGLAPGSSSALGSDAHEAHIAWGAAKAGAFVDTRAGEAARPELIVVAADRAERERIIEVLRSRNVPCGSARNPAAVAAAIEAGTVFAGIVDLSHRSGRDIIARLTDAGIATVVYGDGIDDLVATGLTAQGVRTVVDRDRFLSDPIRFLPALA